MHRTIHALAVLSCSLSLAVFASCGKRGDAKPGPSGSGSAPADHDHDGDGHNDHDHAGDGHAAGGDRDGMGGHGPAIELGAASIEDLEVRCSRDEGDVVAGGEIAVDVRVAGDLARIGAVRIWYGVADATGSMKARAEIEDPKDPAHWHTHVEVPDPIPAEAKVWVELEIDGVGKRTVSFGGG